MSSAFADCGDHDHRGAELDTGDSAEVDTEPAEDLYRAVGLIEDWLLHASDAALDELAEFAYGAPAEHHRRDLRWITELLGNAAIRLRPPPRPAPTPPATTRPATGQGHGQERSR